MNQPARQYTSQLEKRPCGSSGPQLSVLGLGCWQFGGGDYWGESNQENVDRVVRTALDAGINYFDTAEMYNDGRSEAFLGKALKGTDRDRVVVGTKIWPTHLQPQAIRAHCEASLQRLAMDTIDIYMVHWPCNARTYPLFVDSAVMGVTLASGKADTPSLPEAVEMLLTLQAEGKIRHLGVSNHAVERLEEIRHLGGEYVVNQLAYNLASRGAEYEILPHCEKTGTGVIAYMVLLQGLLTDRYASLDEVPDWYTRTRHFRADRSPKTRHGEAGAEAQFLEALTGLRALADECGSTLADLAVQWAIAGPGITCALIGTQSTDRLHQAVQAAGRSLAPEVLKHLDALTQSLKEQLGPSLDIFEGVANDRTR
ncbi:MAG: aldo/keto reductase [Planctomycetes bacterium]|nr:aldo/keto reductase [Planctomycetota bacterium]